MFDGLESIGDLVEPLAMQVLLSNQRLESGAAFSSGFEGVSRNPYAVYRRIQDAFILWTLLPQPRTSRSGFDK